MANNAFDRTIVNTRERPLSQDIDQAQSTLDRSLRDSLSSLFKCRILGTGDPTGTPMDGFIGDSFRVVFSDASNVIMSSGIGFFSNPADTPQGIVTSLNPQPGLDDLSPYKPIVLNSQKTIPISPADPTNDRIDLIEVRYNRQTTDSTVRQVFDPSSGAFVNSTVFKTLSFSLDGFSPEYSTGNGTQPIHYKIGVAAASPTIPAVSPGYLRVATIRVKAVTGVATNSIGDYRPYLMSNGISMMSWRGNVSAGAPIQNTINTPSGSQIILWKGAVTANTAAFSIVIICGSTDNVKSSLSGNASGANGITDFANTIIKNPIIVDIGAPVVTLVGAVTGLQAALNNPTLAAPNVLVSNEQEVIIYPINFVLPRNTIQLIGGNNITFTANGVQPTGQRAILGLSNMSSASVGRMISFSGGPVTGTWNIIAFSSPTAVTISDPFVLATPQTVNVSYTETDPPLSAPVTTNVANVTFNCVLSRLSASI